VNVRPPLLYTASQRLGPLVEEETFARLYRSREFLATSFDQPLRLSEPASQACLSQFHYHRMFVRAFGETPHDFLTRRRIDRAKQLLARDECPVTEVCLAVGYESLGSFGSLFRSMVGRSLRRVFPAPYVAPHRFIPACFLLSFGSRPF
jgi:AraC-like DNA-binding protein